MNFAVYKENYTRNFKKTNKWYKRIFYGVVILLLSLLSITMLIKVPKKHSKNESKDTYTNVTENIDKVSNTKKVEIKIKNLKQKLNRPEEITNWEKKHEEVDNSDSIDDFIDK